MRMRSLLTNERLGLQTVALLSLALTIAACGGDAAGLVDPDDEVATIASVEISFTRDMLTGLGDTVGLTAVALDENGLSVHVHDAITWLSSTSISNSCPGRFTSISWCGGGRHDLVEPNRLSRAVQRTCQDGARRRSS